MSISSLESTSSSKQWPEWRFSQHQPIISIFRWVSTPLVSMGVCSTAWTCSTWTPCRGATSAVQVGPLHDDHCLFEKVVASLHTRSMWYSYIPDVVIEVWILGWYSRKNIVMIRECCEKYEAVERQRRGWAGRFLTASHSGRCSTFPSYYFSQIGRQRRICTFPE